MNKETLETLLKNIVIKGFNEVGKNVSEDGLIPNLCVYWNEWNDFDFTIDDGSYGKSSEYKLIKEFLDKTYTINVDGDQVEVELTTAYIDGEHLGNI